MKDIYIIMNRQNILNFYGSKLDLKLDSSELYDYQLTTNEVDYDTDVLDLSTSITYSALTIDSSCLITNLNDQKPWIIPIDSHYTGDTCDFTVRRRTEKGWTLDFVFNRQGSDWSEGKVFYYLGTDDNSGLLNYLDNNLSFQFTNDGKIKWVAHRYSGYCDNSSSYISTHYMSDDETSPLCVTDNNKDFNLTIVFNRNKEYDGCDLENEGGFNDLIQGPHAVEFIKPITGVTGMTSTQIVTGYTITNTIQDWVTGGTITTQYIEELNKKWSDERDKRLGDLKIYLNGNLIYTKHNWEEVIPSYRDNQTIIQSWGGGQDYSWFGNYSTCGFNLKSIKYYEEPLDFVHIKHNFRTLSGYTFEICNPPCVNNVFGYFTPTPTPTSTPRPTSTPTPTATQRPTSTPTPTPTSTSTPTPTPTPTPRPLNTNCFKFIYTGGTVNTGRFSLNGNELTIFRYSSDSPVKSPNFSGLTQNQFIDFTDFNTSTYIGTFTVDNNPITYLSNRYIITGNFAGPQSFTSAQNYNVCLPDSGPTPTPQPTNTSTPTSTPTPTDTPEPTSTPFITPTPYPFTHGGFTFDADYIIITYSFTDGSDLDTRTRISSPDIGQNDLSTYIGWCRSEVYPDPMVANPILTWSGDNTGQGFESVFINLIEFKLQYPSYSTSTITIDMNAIWYGSLGTQPIIMDVMLYKEGTISLNSENFLFINEGYSGIYGVASNGTNLLVIDNDTEKCPQQEHIATLQYNLLTYNGQFI
jgi:hypothetical protein